MQDELHAHPRIFQVHQQVPGLLHYPRLGRVPGGSEDPDAAGAVLLVLADVEVKRDIVHERGARIPVEASDGVTDSARERFLIRLDKVSAGEHLISTVLGFALLLTATVLIFRNRVVDWYSARIGELSDTRTAWLRGRW